MLFIQLCGFYIKFLSNWSIMQSTILRQMYFFYNHVWSCMVYLSWVRKSMKKGLFKFLLSWYKTNLKKCDDVTQVWRKTGFAMKDCRRCWKKKTLPLQNFISKLSKNTVSLTSRSYLGLNDGKTKVDCFGTDLLRVGGQHQKAILSRRECPCFEHIHRGPQSNIPT